MIIRKTTLSENIVAFCRYLRDHGFSISVLDESTALEAISVISYENRLEFQTALAITLVKNVKQLDLFNRLFEDYWKELEKAIDSKIKKEKSTKSRPALSEEKAFNALKSWLNGNRSSNEEQIASYSAEESLNQKDFSNIPPSQLDELTMLIQELSRKLARSLARREQKTNALKRFNFSRTIRKNMKFGGDILAIAYQKPKKNRLKLVLLCDVSKSMDLYSSFFVQFMYAFQHVYKQIETFVFSTQLIRITNELKSSSFDEVKSRLSTQVQIWSGGTKIGHSLEQLVTEFGHKFLHQQTVVIILSDGWETGEPEKLRNAMEILHRKSNKVIWLNPLAGNPHFQPNTNGMKTAMPYIDHFASVHNLESLSKIVKFI